MSMAILKTDLMELIVCFSFVRDVKLSHGKNEGSSLSYFLLNEVGFYIAVSIDNRHYRALTCSYVVCM